MEEACVCVCAVCCMCIFALSICKRCIDLSKDIPSNVLGYDVWDGWVGGGGGGQLSLSLRALKKTSIYQHFQAWGGVRSGQVVRSHTGSHTKKTQQQSLK